MLSPLPYSDDIKRADAQNTRPYIPASCCNRFPLLAFSLCPVRSSPLPLLPHRIRRHADSCLPAVVCVETAALQLPGQRLHLPAGAGEIALEALESRDPNSASAGPHGAALQPLAGGAASSHVRAPNTPVCVQGLVGETELLCASVLRSLKAARWDARKEQVASTSSCSVEEHGERASTSSCDSGALRCVLLGACVRLNLLSLLLSCVTEGSHALFPLRARSQQRRVL